MRIVSLLPAATDLVFALGLRDTLVGRTHECVNEDGVLAAVPIVTKTNLRTDIRTSREIHEAVGALAMHEGSSIYEVDLALLDALQPDLILTQELCAVCAVSYAQLDASMRSSASTPRILSLEPERLSDVLDTLLSVGAAAQQTAEHCRAIRGEFQARLDAVAHRVAGRERARVAMLEWLDPPWPVGHWVPDQVEIAGGEEVLGARGAQTSSIGFEDVGASAPDVLVLCPCGLAMSQTMREAAALLAHKAIGDTPAAKSGEIWVANGPMLFNCPSTRLVRGAEVLAFILHGIGSISPEEAVRIG